MAICGTPRKKKKKKNEGISEVDYANLMAACTECIHQAKIVSHRWRLLGIGYARLDGCWISDFRHSQAHIINCLDACNGPPWKITFHLNAAYGLKATATWGHIWPTFFNQHKNLSNQSQIPATEMQNSCAEE